MTIDVKAQLDELHKISDEQWERYRKLLPESDDVSLVVLKGHLIIEEMLYSIAQEHCAYPNSLERANLTSLSCLMSYRRWSNCPLALGAGRRSTFLTPYGTRLFITLNLKN